MSIRVNATRRLATAPLGFALAALALAACSDDCQKGKERCDGNHAQYCAEPFFGDQNSWQDFPQNADCGKTPGCTCVMHGDTATCAASAPSTSTACPTPGCGSPGFAAGALTIPLIVRRASRRRWKPPT